MIPNKSFNLVSLGCPKNRVDAERILYAMTRAGFTFTHQPEQAAIHAQLYEKFRPDNNAAERVVALHRSRNPAADHAAEPVAIYELTSPAAATKDEPAEQALISAQP